VPILEISSPTIVHHMAALDNQTAPPNSLEAISACLDMGAAFIEVDVTALADGDYLLVHDEELESETNGRGAVATCTSAQARELFYKEHGVVTQYHVPLLSQVVQLFEHAGTPTRLQLDFKNVYPLPSDEPLHRLVNLIEPLRDRVLVSTGADWQLRKLRHIAPWLLLGFDIMYYIDWEPLDHVRDPRAFPKRRGAYGYYDDHMLALEKLWTTAEYLNDRCESLMGLVPDVSVFYIEHNLLAQSLRDGFNWASALHERGIKLDAWTMDTTNPLAVENAKTLYAAGLDLFTTNTPLAMAQLLKSV
jgi:glycerophosphoryl diester phosphodiesterase